MYENRRSVYSQSKKVNIIAVFNLFFLYANAENDQNTQKKGIVKA